MAVSLTTWLEKLCKFTTRMESGILLPGSRAVHRSSAQEMVRGSFWIAMYNGLSLIGILKLCDAPNRDSFFSFLLLFDL